jgi:hypothetical protein
MPRNGRRRAGIDLSDLPPSDRLPIEDEAAQSTEKMSKTRR